jgi:hypothetical protein
MDREITHGADIVGRGFNELQAQMRYERLITCGPRGPPEHSVIHLFNKHLVSVYLDQVWYGMLRT